MNAETIIEQAKECFREMILIVPDLNPEFVIPDVADNFLPSLPSENTEVGYSESGESLLEDFRDTLIEALWSEWEKSKYEVE